MPEDEPDAMGIGVPPPPVAYLGPLILGLLLNRQIPVPFLPRRLTRVLGLPLFGGGVLLGGWTYRTMRRTDTPIIGEPVVPGKPTTSLITDGPFRYTRNPGYLGAAIVYAGIASLANALWAVLLLPVTLLTMQYTAIECEERYLEGKFGEEYLSYNARVRRWVQAFLADELAPAGRRLPLRFLSEQQQAGAFAQRMLCGAQPARSAERDCQPERQPSSNRPWVALRPHGGRQLLADRG